MSADEKIDAGIHEERVSFIRKDIRTNGTNKSSIER